MTTLTSNRPVRFCFDDCEFLSLTEKDQDDRKAFTEPHICKRYRQLLHHAGFHPRIVRVYHCDYDGVVHVHKENSDQGLQDSSGCHD